MRINSSCVLHSTTSLNARVLPLIGRVGTLELSSGQPLVFKTTTPKQQEDVLRTSTVKAIGFAGSRIFVKTSKPKEEPNTHLNSNNTQAATNLIFYRLAAAIFYQFERKFLS